MKIDGKLKTSILRQYLSRIIKVLLSLIANPLIARYLGPEKLGKLAYVTSISFIFIPFIDFVQDKYSYFFLLKD